MENLKSKVLAHKAVIVIVAILALVGVAKAYTLSQSINVAGDYNNYEAVGQPSDVNTDVNYGAVSSGDIYQDVNIRGTLTYGGGSYSATTTAAATYTLVAKDLQKYAYLDIMNNTPDSDLTFTLPATSTMISLLPEIGSTRQWLIQNATSTGAHTLTLVKGAGMDLVAVTANDDVIDPGEWTRLTCTQIAYRAVNDENIVCIVDELLNAD